MDCCAAASLDGPVKELDEHAMTYDVICRWIRKILERWEKLFPELIPMISRTKMLLPSMHLHAHKELCQLVYALCYADGFADSYGEGVETPWHELNQAGIITREMTKGGRIDWLNSVFIDWNWLKFLGMRT
ncbi:hypothetical protein OH76DRAFT_1354723 [Lentinus brumalis]|uniref:Uncharacterized protein n=1 Tax=Lentinus brumalis TaxID=2498619 RepID=A0A371D3M3_9APHY|nr:hypothetical protein OH76DRAFT_1354723 [Polyporus brumalis]